MNRVLPMSHIEPVSELALKHCLIVLWRPSCLRLDVGSSAPLVSEYADEARADIERSDVERYNVDWILQRALRPKALPTKPIHNDGVYLRWLLHQSPMCRSNLRSSEVR
jgi:hypothetical protein